MIPTLQAALDARGYTTLTPVQEAVLAPDYAGRDLLVSAQTGSGKTLGFGLAIAPALLGEAERFDAPAAPLGLVIAPTRELALQVKRELSWLFAEAGAVLASCVGGMDMRDERRALARGAHIVVATPGRLRDHLMRETIDLSQTRAVVLDEADEMLDLGFREDLEFILAAAPEDRQTLLFSATVPNSILRIAETYQKDAARISTKAETEAHADISYRAMMVAETDTDGAVINTLRFYEAPNAIVFANTRAMVNRLTTRLSNRGFQVVALSGELSQSERSHALQAMRDGRAQVCVATDVAARGIDLPSLDLVVHAELPKSHETLLHRSGRTGRAGRKGVSAMVVTKKSRKKAERILGMAKVKADWTPAPSADDVQEADTARLLDDPAWRAEVSESQRALIAQLTEAFSPDELAAGVLALFHASRTAPEDLTDPNTPAAPRPEFGPSVWFSLSIGREDGADPRRVLPMLCKHGGLNKDAIGAIRVRGGQTFVQISEAAAAGFVASIGPDGTVEDGVVATQLDQAPEFANARPAGGAPKGKRNFDKPPHRAFDKAPHRKGPRADGPKPRPAPAKPSRMAEAIEDGAVKPARPAKSGPKPGGKPKSEYKSADKPHGKPGGKPRGAAPGSKPSGKPGGPRGGKPGEFAGGKRDGKPAGAPGGKPGGKPKSPTAPKGPPPPKGKANSKKNKARAAAKAAGIGKGGDSAPRRPKR